MFRVRAPLRPKKVGLKEVYSEFWRGHKLQVLAAHTLYWQDCMAATTGFAQQLNELSARQESVVGVQMDLQWHLQRKLTSRVCERKR